MNHIVKRKGHKEIFDQRKIYASVFAACMVLRMTDEESELIADSVTKEAIETLKGQPELKSVDIHRVVETTLKKYHPDAAYIYDTHRDIN